MVKSTIKKMMVKRMEKVMLKEVNPNILL